MILDILQRSDRYAGFHPGFRTAFKFLMASDRDSLGEGRHEIDGDAVFAIVARSDGRGREAAPLESHRRYIDIQYVVSGTDAIGWRNRDTCDQPDAPFDANRDIGFYRDAPALWFDLPPGHFTIFFPEDAHAPLAGSGSVHKIVVKVAVTG
jgi:biofilm protein TabA